MSVRSALAAGCPDCPPAAEARALVFTESFWTNVWFALLPFVVVAIAVRWFVLRLDQRSGDERGA